MSLTSFNYLLFLPTVFLLYWLAFSRNKTLQNAFLLVSSLAFYAFWDWKFLVLLLITAGSTFYIGRRMAAASEKKARRMLLLLSLLLNLGILAYFKYFNFFVDSFVDLMSLFGLHIGFSTMKIILPVGISFYTFAALSYCIDVYRRTVEPTDDWLAYFAYVTFFPSLLSGPISRATTQLPQYRSRRLFSYEKAATGIRAILWGLFVKLCVADCLGVYVDTVYGSAAEYGGTTLLLASVLFTIQIYADFSGYSLIAIGSGKLLGIDLPENFRRPYFSRTVTEFWRRWHISLTTWFRDYIYFPLGGSRVGKTRWALNTLIVFLVSGLWHGAAYTFIIWGALHGTLMILERLLYGKHLKSIPDRPCPANAIRICVTFCLVSLTWIFFRMGTAGEAVTVVGKLFTDFGMPFIDTVLVPASISMVILFVKDYVDEYHSGIRLLSSGHKVIRYATCVALICYILLMGELDGASFIYFQF